MIYLQITTGRGPPECQIALRNIVERMKGDRSSPWLKIVKQTETSAIVRLDASGAREYADSWIGTILWICDSPVRKNHKRKNWFVGIKEIDLPEHGPTEIFDKDLEWQFMKSSGKGGQHANKNDTAVRLIHKPTSITVVAQDERSQKRNKVIAVARLAEALARQQADAIKALEAENWQQHNELERGNPIRTFSGPDFAERGSGTTSVSGD